MKRSIKLLSIVMAIVLTMGMFVVYPLSSGAETVQTRTVMLYISGSNLESDYASATWNLVQCMKAEYDENLNFIVITGGSKKWNIGSEYLSGAETIDPKYNQIWKIEGKREDEDHGKMTLLEPTGIEGCEQTLMSSPGTMTAFADYCYKNYPADQYDIIMWNHGGGPAFGFGKDDHLEGFNMMSLSQMAQSFSDMQLIKDGKKFEMINFDACLMASVEIVVTLEDYTDYLVASPETEPGNGHEYTTWLNALKRDPSMNGFALGKIIVDAMVASYTNDGGTDDLASLSVIDVNHFRERLLPQLAALDELLISEAKNVGSRNNRYNFYDELYSIANSYGYSFGLDSLYDLGNLAGALSVPQSEVNNVTQKQINNAENSYTNVALNILRVLSDQDGSGDDVIYARGSRTMKKTVSTGYLRDINGEVVWADDNYITVPITGLSLFFGDGHSDNSQYFINALTLAADQAQSPDEKNYLDRRSVAAAFYCLIFQMGKTVSKLSDKGEKYINYRKVKKLLQEDESTWISCQTMIDRLVSAGEFDSAEEAEDYLSLIVAQQSKEVVSKNKVKVKQIENIDGSFTDYQVTVSNTSAQAFMSVNSAAMVTCSNTDTEEFNFIMRRIYGSASFDQLYPRGINLKVSVSEGTFDSADYYNSIDDTAAQINQRIYTSTSSVWSVPRMKKTCFVLYDDDGAPHIADIHYMDKSCTTAYIPIMIYWPAGENKSEGFRAAYLYISKTDGEWQINGVTLNTNEGAAERSYLPMDNQQFAGCRFAPAIYTADAVYDYDTYMPISTFDDIDITKDNWGVTFGEMSIDELDDVRGFRSIFYVEDVYGYQINVSDQFIQADGAAQNGDVVHDINLAEASVEPSFYNGLEQKPAVTLTLNGKELVETEDYKVIYLGYTLPGTAYIAVLGLGDYIGTNYVPFTIRYYDILGDIDDDGEISAIDVTYIQRICAQIEVPFTADQIIFGDVDGDGEVTLMDASYIQRWLAKLKPSDNIG